MDTDPILKDEAHRTNLLVEMITNSMRPLGGIQGYVLFQLPLYRG